MDTIDYDAPRDFMDTMLNEANNNDSEIGYHTIAMSIVGILVAKHLWTTDMGRSCQPGKETTLDIITNKKSLFGWIGHSVKYDSLGFSHLDGISRSSRKVL